ncbi:MAG: SUMF1/EgtB/PvdO family nonheme iron enzyme [Treponema sp.]|nr:SUMF1/EgtB/PvdO family nonheme iron enzyme [Treponema sp.]
MFGKKNRDAAGDREILPEDQIHLKPVLGLRPGIYLTFIYSLIILIILFFILLYPGLSRPGSIVRLKTEPAGAALRVDGLYMGTSPARIFVPRGVHDFELILPGFSPLRFTEDIKGRLFASLLFPRVHPLEKQLSAAGAVESLALGAADFAAWTFAGEPTAAYQIPLSLSEGAYRSGPAAKNEQVAMDNIIRAASRFGVTRAALRDLIRAKVLIDNGGLSPSPISLFRSAGDITGFLSETPGAAAWLAGILPPEAASLVTESSWYQTQSREGENTRAAERLPAGPGGRFRLGPVNFTAIPGGVLAQGPVFPRKINIGDFWLSETEVSPRAFEAFLAARPQWARENLESLREQGLVTGDYLSGGYTGAGAQEMVSWHAANAFCSWLSSQLPAAMEDWEVRLPAEAEWEYAARSVENWTVSEIRDLSGGSWEWCGDPYAPLNFIEAPPEAAEAVGSPERSLRGGAKGGSSVQPEIRASLPPASCSPFVSFRPVIARKKTGA